MQCDYTQLSAKDAFAAGGDAGNEDAVCRLQHYDGRTDLFDHADALVAEPAWLTGGNVTLEDGKVGAANRRQSHSDDSVGQRNDAGLDRDRDKVRSGHLAPHSLGACRAETTQLARGAPVGAKWVWIFAKRQTQFVRR